MVSILDSGSQQLNSVGPSQEDMMGEVSGAGGGVGGSSSDTGMASNVAGRTIGSSDVGAAGLTGLVGGVRPGEGGVGGAVVPGLAISAGIGTGGESGTAGSHAGPGSGQGLQQIPQQGQSEKEILLGLW